MTKQDQEPDASGVLERSFQVVRRLTRAALVLVILAGSLLVGSLLIGRFLPEEQEVTREQSFRAEPARVFAMLVDVKNYEDWQSTVRAVALHSEEPLSWTEFYGTSGNERLYFCAREIASPALFVFEVSSSESLLECETDPAANLSARWRIELEEQGDNLTQVRVLETSRYANAFVRFVARMTRGQRIEVLFRDLALALESGPG